MHHNDRIKGENAIIISIDAGKAFDKVQYSFMIKIFSKLGMGETLLNLI